NPTKISRFGKLHGPIRGICSTQSITGDSMPRNITDSESATVDRFHRLLLDVWREACRHIEIGRSAATISAMLAEYTPLRQLIIQRLDVEHRRLSLAAVAPTVPGAEWPNVQEIAERDLPKLRAWIRRGEPVRLGHLREWPPALALLSWPQVSGDLLVAPLVVDHAPIGLMVLLAREGRHAVEKHKEMLAALQEPL